MPVNRRRARGLRPVLRRPDDSRQVLVPHPCSHRVEVVMNTVSIRPDDATIARIIASSASLGQAATKLGFGKTWARRQAKRLGVRFRYRYTEDVLPDDATLVRMMQATTSVAALAKRLGVQRDGLARKAAALGVDCRRRVRDGLPDDEALVREICGATSLAALARRYHVAEHTIRNQVKRLGVRPGDPIPHPRPVPENPADVARRAAENQALSEVAAEEMATVERQRDELARRERKLQDEVERLRLLIAGDAVPTDIDGIMAEAQATGAVVILPKAARAARKASQVDLAKLRTILLFLRDQWVPMVRKAPDVSPEDVHATMVREGLDICKPMKNLRKLRGLGYLGTWQGREVLLDKHVKWGVDPARLIRIYFHYDDVAQVVVIGWMPTHLPIASYS